MEKLVFIGIIATFYVKLSKNYQKMSLKRVKYRFAKRKNSLLICVFMSFSMIIMSTLSSCRTAYGCKVTEKYQVKTDKAGNLSMKRGKTKLFEKDTKSSRKKRKS